MFVRVAPLLIVAFVAIGCGGQGNVFDLDVGQCFQDPGTAEFGRVETVDCEKPHDYEVFAAYQLTTESLPSVEVMQAGCEDRYAAEIGSDPSSSGYQVTIIGPSPQSWTDLNDREVLCVIWVPGERIVGSVLGAAA